jgi:phosphoglycerol transferase MdoB-like AlkP superfamily enzyme
MMLLSLNQENKMFQNLRLNEYKVLGYRLLLAYVFYFFDRILFTIYNKDLLHVGSFSELMRLCYYGIQFDTTAILYVNSLFIVFSILPFWKNTTEAYQKFMFYIYFVLNLVFYATNFIDFIYYKFTFARTTIVALNVLEHETNKAKLFSNFIFEYWDVILLFILFSAFWIYLYKKITVKVQIPTQKIPYFGFTIPAFLIVTILVIGGIRGGDFAKSTRPINLLDASKNVKNIVHSDIVLNTPFAILRTMFTNSFQKTDYKGVTEQLILQKIQPIKQYKNNPPTKPNVVIFILESYGREYIGALNKKANIPNYQSHAPFLDSLCTKSMIFTNAYCNGRQSIHGMSSVLAGIPSFKDAFTSSPYPKQKIESIVSTLESEGYNTSFFHGAANGSMGFLGFGNILGIDNYYGRTEFNNDKEFDGFWGIWDEPFLQFMKQTLDKKKAPFFASVFTVSSHEPFNIPEKYKNKFKDGGVQMHKCVEYTDFALKRFFTEAKKSAWFDNTIFVLVADHTNQVYYDEFNKPFNRFAVPIIIYKPNSKYVGIDEDYAQQIDIYPTILDMIGYQKPFRSWGRSLLDKKSELPFVMNSTETIYQFARGNYICTFDGKNALGFYDKNDKALEHNLIANRNPKMDDLELSCKCFIQDYMNRVVDKRLFAN